MSDYKERTVLLENKYEVFSSTEVSTYGVTRSNFTPSSNVDFSKIENGVGGIIPTSANSYFGGANTSIDYKYRGSFIDSALKGCRPIGIPISEELGAGTYYINRVSGVTYLSSTANTTGTALLHNPKYIHIEIQGGGGSGAASTSFHASSGAGGGGYCYTRLEVPENSYIKIVVGSAVNAPGAKGGNGTTGNASYIYNASGTAICTASGGQYGRDNAGTASGGNASGGIVNITGGTGGSKENSGGGTTSTSIDFNKPEGLTKTRGGFSGGSSNGNNHGGGGGASSFADGAKQDARSAGQSGTKGSGGSGASYNVGGHSGGDGSAGVAYIWY